MNYDSFTHRRQSRQKIRMTSPMTKERNYYNN